MTDLSPTVEVVVSGCFHGTYAQFDRLRLMWAQVAGYGVTDYGGLGGPVVPNIAYDTFSDADCLGEWPEGAPDDPLIIILAHYETAGRIKAEYCGYLADRLHELELRMTRELTLTPASILMTQQFIQGLRYAAGQKLDVQFAKG